MGKEMGHEILGPVKCNMMQRTRKQTNEYTLEGIILQNVDKIKYIRVTITEDLRWNSHVSNRLSHNQMYLIFTQSLLCFCDTENSV